MTITLIGAGTDEGDISYNAYEVLKSANKIIVRTALSKVGAYICNTFKNAIPLDFIYEKSRNFDTLSLNIAKYVLQESKTNDLCYVVDGSVNDDVSCSVILEKHKDVKIFCGISKAEKILSRLNLNGPYTACSSYDLGDKRLSLPLVVYDIDSNVIASKVKLILTDLYGDETNAYKFFGDEKSLIKLYELDYGDNFDYSTAVVITDCSLTEKKRFDFDDLHNIIQILRAENGCPWDRAQTPESILPNTIEETYELLDVVKQKDDSGILEEIGDVILQTVFQIVFAEERGAFNLNDAISAICEKLITRHTHVFGLDKASSAENALEIWTKNKQKEKGYTNGGEYLSAVPKSFPALLRAQKVGNRSRKYNMDFLTAEDVFLKVQEEILEVKEEIKSGNKERLNEECGDLLFAVTSLIRLLGVNCEDSLNMATDKFIKRFIKAERLALNDGKDLKNMTADEVNGYYNEAKKS